MDQSEFGADVLWVSHSHLPEHWGTKPHAHKYFWHLSYVASGHGVWTVNGESHNASKGVCINVPIDVQHCMVTKEDTCEIFEIKYVVSSPELQRYLLAGAPVFHGDAFLKELIRAVHSFSSNRTVYDRCAGNSFLCSMLYHILDLSGGNKSRQTNGAFINTEMLSVPTQKIVCYIDDHYKEQISLEMIAAATNYNRNYICGVFKRDCGFTISTYLNYVRVFHAAELISYGDYSLSQVCAATGFNDPSYFTKTFHGIVGIPPGQYKRAFPDDIFISEDIDHTQEGYHLPVWAGRLFQTRKTGE